MAMTLAELVGAATGTLDAISGIDERTRFRTALAFALGALIVEFLLGTAALGTLFLTYHADFSSMLMAVGFALAPSAYVALLYRAGIATRVPEL